MKQLYIMTGSPGSGKSTWLKENNLLQYTISADDIRLLHQSPCLGPSGEFTISAKNDGKVWKLLLNLVEQRMSRGELIIIDACHSRPKDYTQYKKLCDRYRYRAFAINFRDIPIEQSIEQNKSRASHKCIPEEAIRNIYTRFENNEVPGWVSLIQRDEFKNVCKYRLEDFSHYDNIYVIGDIHGCYSALTKLLDKIGGIKDDDLYVFIGDFIDRGIENHHVINLVLKLQALSNVITLGGNHEEHLFTWGFEKEIKSREFIKKTLPQLEESGITRKNARQIYRRLNQIFYGTFHGKTIVATHGGIPLIPDNLIHIATDQFVRGVGKYEDLETIYKTFNNKTDENTWQVHGHRNIQRYPVINGRCINLEGQVEYGGFLRCVRFSKDNLDVIEIKNDHFNKELINQCNKKVGSISTVDELLDYMQNDTGVLEKPIDDNISAFNFKRKVFHKSIWNDVRYRARGLFINVADKNIAARAYDKFFNLGEREDTSIDKLYNLITFPVKAYKKYNGFLGITGWDSTKNKLMICSKSTDSGPYSKYFEDILKSQYNTEVVQKLVKDNNLSLIFEVIDPKNDPHIIKYDAPRLVLLDAIYRSVEYKKVDYDTLISIAKEIGVDVKQIYKTIDTWQDFLHFIEECKTTEDKIEGVVIEGENNYQVKIKFPYYTRWKICRVILNQVQKRRFEKIIQNSPDREINSFINWVKDQNENWLLGQNIISAREAFLTHS